MTRTTNSVPEPVGADMLGLLKTLKLGALADTLPPTRSPGPPTQNLAPDVPATIARR